MEGRVRRAERRRRAGRSRGPRARACTRRTLLLALAARAFCSSFSASSSDFSAGVQRRQDTFEQAARQPAARRDARGTGARRGADGAGGVRCLLLLAGPRASAGPRSLFLPLRHACASSPSRRRRCPASWRLPARRCASARVARAVLPGARPSAARCAGARAR